MHEQTATTNWNLNRSKIRLAGKLLVEHILSTIILFLETTSSLLVYAIISQQYLWRSFYEKKK